MLPETYKIYFKDFVLGNLAAFYEGVKPWYMDEVGHTDSLKYFDDHFARFWEIISLIRKHVPAPQRLCEIGSFYPYVTLYWDKHTDLYDIIPSICPTAKAYESERVSLVDWNACTDSFPQKKYDVITLSEVMEHLPCNLFDVEKKVIDILEPGGHLVVTYPTQYGNHAFGYNEDMGHHEAMHGGHLREFTDETVELFFKQLTKVEQVVMKYPAYGRIVVAIYRNDS